MQGVHDYFNVIIIFLCLISSFSGYHVNLGLSVTCDHAHLQHLGYFVMLKCYLCLKDSVDMHIRPKFLFVLLLLDKRQRLFVLIFCFCIHFGAILSIIVFLIFLLELLNHYGD